MIRVGIIGYGFMGRMHAKAYARDDRTQLVAIADPRANVSQAAAAGNIETAVDPPLDLSDVALTDDAATLLKRDDIDAVSICTPTSTHAPLAILSIQAGKNTLIEKPLALNSNDAAEVVEASTKTKLCIMPGMCMRFWPEWAWLKQTIDSGHYGPVLSAVFTRFGARPDWGQDFYSNPDLTGGRSLICIFTMLTSFAGASEIRRDCWPMG
ncbi:MAG: Gfo/Idh/MocA family oxidoreductase [Planctomycetota bacterium]|nr:Gfo/Idh/MocA family oxidoreductase [Planctomycetota bacterium]